MPAISAVGEDGELVDQRREAMDLSPLADYRQELIDIYGQVSSGGAT